jgi:hypothetical protein
MGCLQSAPSSYLLENGAPNSSEGHSHHADDEGTEMNGSPAGPPLVSNDKPKQIKEKMETKIRRKSKILFGEDSTGTTTTGSSVSSSTSSSLGPPQCRREDFLIHDFLAKGGMGAVYRATRRSDQLKVALKFFGYDEKCPDMDSIQQEVTALTALRGLDGVVPLLGTFPDTANGILGKKGYKIWPKSYPVLAMPLLEGGALIDRIHVRTSVCENDLKHWFKQCIVGLGNIHSKGFIHRDMKLENIMLETMADDSLVRPLPVSLSPSPCLSLPLSLSLSPPLSLSVSLSPLSLPRLAPSPPLPHSTH